MKPLARISTLVTLLGFCLLNTVRAQSVFLNGSTTYNSSNSFTPNGVPDGATQVSFLASGGTYSVNLGGSGFAQSISFVNGTSTQGGTYNFALGGGTLTVGPYSGSTNTLEVSGGTTVNFSGGTVDIQAGNAAVGDLGGSGRLILTNTTFNFRNTEADSSFFIGGDGVGSASLVGTSIVQASSTVTPNSNYTIFIGANVTKGLTSASGTLTIGSGTEVNLGVNGFLLLGTTASYVNQPGPFASTGGTGVINNDGTINLTAGAVASLGDVTGGSGTINNTSNGTINVNASTIIVGYDANTVGIINLSGGTISLIGSELILGSNGTGTITQSGGNLNFDNGSTFLIGSDAANGMTGSGSYNQTGGTATFSSEVDVGTNASESGTINQSGGISTYTTLTLGNAASTGKGSVVLSGPATSTMNVSNFNIGAGSNGSAIFSQTGGTANFTAVNVGTIGAGTGSINQSGGTSSYTTLTLGSTTANQGEGFVVLSGGAMSIGMLVIQGTTSSFTLAGGLLAINPQNISGAGQFIINSGTFQPIANGEINYNANLNGAFTLDTTHVPITYSGNISGTGSVNATGGQTVTLTGMNTFTGGAGVFGGSTLVATVGTGLAATNNLFVDTGSTADLTVAVPQTLSGTISGGGTVDIIDGGNAVTLSGPVDSTGTIDTTGTGLLTVDQGLFNTLTSGGALNVAGPVAVEGALTAPGVTVVTGGVLATDSITAPLVTNNGTLAVFGPTGSISTISGNLVSPGTLVVRANGTTADLYSVAGMADFTGGGNLSVLAAGTNSYTVLTSAGLTGLPTATSTPLLTVNVAADPTGKNLILNTTQNPILPYAQTSNQQAVARGIDGGLVGPINPSTFSFLAALDSVSTGAQLNGIIPAVLDELSPEKITFGPQIAVENSTFLIQSLDANLAAIRSGSSGLDTQGLSLAPPDMSSSLGRSLLAYYAPAPNGINYYPTDSSDTMTTPGEAGPISDSATAPAVVRKPISSRDYHYYNSKVPNDQVEGSRFNEFLSGNVVLADLNQKNGSGSNAPNKANYTSGNGTVGASFRINPHLAAGLDFNYNHTHADTDGSGSKTAVDTYSPGIFATFYEKGFFLNGIFSYGHNDYSDSRNINVPGFNGTAVSSPSGSQYVTDLDGGYDFHPYPGLTVTPAVGLQYTHVDIGSFTETGANPFDLTLNEQNTDSERTRLGGTINYAIPAGVVVFLPNISAYYQHEFGDSTATLTSNFGELPGSTGFTINGPQSGRDSALLGAGFDALVAQRLVVYLHYFADVGNDEYFAQTVEGGFRAAF